MKFFSHLCIVQETNYAEKLTNDFGQLENWNKYILDGDQDSLSTIYFCYYDLLFDYGLRHTHDKQLVEDVIQDIFINFIKFRKTTGEVKNLTGYILSTFRNQLFHDFQKNKRFIMTGEFPEERFDYFKSPEQQISENDNSERIHSTIRQCIGNLTAKQQEIIFLRFEREISYHEIALILNISVDSCYKSTYRAIKTIRSEVEMILGKGANILLLAFFRHSV